MSEEEGKQRKGRRVETELQERNSPFFNESLHGLCSIMLLLSTSMEKPEVSELQIVMLFLVCAGLCRPKRH